MPKLSPGSITIPCPRCGDDMVVPLAADGPYTDENGQQSIHLHPEVDRIRHQCNTTRPHRGSRFTGSRRGR